MRTTIGLVLALLIGMGCRLADIPLPAPLAVIGALLVLAMTTGHLLADRWLAKVTDGHTDDEPRTKP